jgi:hypothetical protein
MKKIDKNILSKLPLEFQSIKTVKVISTNKKAKIKSKFYESNNVFNESFHRPISKCFTIYDE